MTIKRSAVSAAIVCAISASANAGTDIFFNPLTQSSAVATPNHPNELNNPWQVPAGLSQENLTNLLEIQNDVYQSVVRWDGSNNAAMFDMIAYDPTGKYLFIPHETFVNAGVSRYDIANDFNQVLFAGDQGGLNGDWSNDWGALDPARFTPNGTVWAGEEWSGEGRVIEIMNPYADPADVQIREMHSIANVSHEGIGFSKQKGNVVYYVDENNSGSIYRFVGAADGDFDNGQTFVLAVDGFAGDAAANWNQNGNGEVRTGAATWVAITDASGKPTTTADPFAAGQSNGRAAADEVNATPFGRPEDVEVGTLASGNEVLFVAATSEQTVYSIEMTGADTAFVRVFADESNTPKNLGFPATTGHLTSPDNLAQDALGNIFIVEDKPNGDDIGGDIWFARDTDNDGVAESIDHFMSIQVDGAEATGMVFNPVKPTEFVVAVQHPDSTNISKVDPALGFGDAVWRFDLSNIVPPICNDQVDEHKKTKTCTDNESTYVERLTEATQDKGKTRRQEKDDD